MEIILKEDVIGLGYKNDIVNVKSGYGRNYLIPYGKGVIASDSAKKQLAEDLKQKAVKLAKVKAEAEALAQITQGVDQISSVVQTNSATAEQSAAASQEMANQSRILKELTAKFQLRDIEDEVDNVTGAEAQHGRA